MRDEKGRFAALMARMNVLSNSDAFSFSLKGCGHPAKLSKTTFGLIPHHASLLPPATRNMTDYPS